MISIDEKGARVSELVVAAGLASEAGQRAENQDFCAAWLGDAHSRATHGALAVLADGVGGTKGGRIAAELACREWIAAYLCTPVTLGIAACAHRALAPFNQWLYARGRNDPAMAGAATTFAALVLRGRRAHALHVGDSRIWHFRAGVLTLLTENHSLPNPNLRHVLYRAVGMEPDVRLDRQEQMLSVHDRLLITSDGVHNVLPARALALLLAARGAAERDAAAIVAAARVAGSGDNMTAVVLDVLALPDPDQAGIAAIAAALPVLPPPRRGDSIDGFRLDQVLSDGRYSRVFRATDADGTACVLKFPKPTLLSEHGARLAFTRESLVGAQVHSPYVAEVLDILPDRQSRLYVALRHYEGETLAARLARGRLSYSAGLAVSVGIVRGAVALHRRGIIHRDIKPDNVLLPAEGAVGTPRLLDLGVARLPHVEEFAASEIPGTPGYMAPELYDGQHGDAASDQFAIGVTLFQLFTGHLPFGEAEPFSRPRFGQPAAPDHLRPDMPAWLAATLTRTVAVRPENRFADLLELLDALEGGSARATPARRHRPLAERDPVRLWQIVSAILAMCLFALLWQR